jgi:hypothetical protein
MMLAYLANMGTLSRMPSVVGGLRCDAGAAQIKTYNDSLKEVASGIQLRRAQGPGGDGACRGHVQRVHSPGHGDRDSQICCGEGVV